MKQSCDFRADCGHQFHLKFFAEKWSQVECKGKCPSCENEISEFDLYRDLLRAVDMSDEEKIYLDLSGTTAMDGLMRKLLESDESPLEEVLERCFLMHGNIYSLFPSFESDVFEYALRTGERRVLKFLKTKKLNYKCKLSDTLFHDAFEKDWIEVINDLHEMGIYPYFYKTDLNPLMFAAKTGNYKMMDRLLDAGADITMKHHGMPPFSYACQSIEFKSTAAKIKFIDKYWGEYIGKTGYDYHTETVLFDRYSLIECPYEAAVLYDDFTFVKWLIQKQVHTIYGFMNYAVKYGSFEMIKFLEEQKLTYAYISDGHLQLACERKSFEIIEYIVQTKKHKATPDDELLRTIIKNNDIELVQMFLKLKTKFDWNLVYTAAKHGLFEMTKLLLESAAHTNRMELISNYNYKSLLNNDDYEKIIEIIEYFLSLNPDINVNAQNLLIRICDNDKNMPIAEKLIKLGVKAEIIRESLLEASRKGCTKLMKLLLKNGADFTYVGAYERNCYLCALESGNVDAIKLALPLCDKNSTDKYGKGPFHFISKFKSESDAVEIFEYLVNVGVRMDVVDKDKTHPMLDRFFYGEMPLLALKYCEWEDAADSNVIGELLQSRYDKPVLKLYNALKQEIKNKNKK